VPLSNAERSRRKREKAKLRAATAVVEAAPVTGADAAVREFLELAVTWADEQTTAQGQGMALKALQALDAIEEDASESSLMRFAEREGIPGAFRLADDRARQKAIEMIAARTVELRAGRATITTIRTGLAAADALRKRRAKFDASAVDWYLAKALIGGPPPADLADSRVDDEMPADEDGVYAFQPTHYEGNRP
jgi:hypothetical protein